MDIIGHLAPPEHNINPLCDVIEELKAIAETDVMIVSFENTTKNGKVTIPHYHFFMSISGDPTIETIRARIKKSYGLTTKGQLSITRIRKTRKEAICYVVKQGNYVVSGITPEQIEEAEKYGEETYGKSSGYLSDEEFIEKKYMDGNIGIQELLEEMLRNRVKHNKQIVERHIRSKVIRLFLIQTQDYARVAENIKISLPFYIIGNV